MFKIEDVKFLEYDLKNEIAIFHLHHFIIHKNVNKKSIAYKMNYDSFVQKAQLLSNYKKKYK